MYFTKKLCEISFCYYNFAIGKQKHNLYLLNLITMILIADSGSTKTHWSLCTASGQYNEYFTDGINPFQQTPDAIRNSIADQLLPQMADALWGGDLTAIYFYGAGCTPEKCPLVVEALKANFKKATTIEVYSDMVGAARGLLVHKSGIACILGTGSNSCLYNGDNIVKNVPALGFILGDEGSGAVLGKRLVADLLKNQLTEELKAKFLKQYDLTQAIIIENVYRKAFPNRFLASLSKFCAENISDKRIYQLVYNHFNDFVVRNLKQYYIAEDGSTIPVEKLPVGFIGSIAYYYQDVLKKVLADNGLVVAQILQSPMEGMREFHQKDITPTK